ncbi:MAG: hypothetical protein RL030_1927 [Pseudomonadota bacterium]|jgi:TolB-like protein/Tfp pilus assembly protein PilF
MPVMPTSRPDVFLSYSREDQATARRFAEGLEREGFNVWWDQTLHSGEAYDKVTENALREAKAVVLLWSKASVDSRWVRAEATTADRLGTLVPVMIEPCSRPIMFELTHTSDLSNWKGDRSDPAWQAYVADVWRSIGQGAPKPSAPDPASTGHPSISPSSTQVKGRTAVWLPGVAVAILAVLVGAGFWWMQKGRQAAAPATTAGPVVPSSPVTLAVLPFADLSSTKDQEYFSDGLTEEILNQLAQIPELRVTGRTSSFSFKGKNEDLRGIAKQLGVANLLEGSIRKDGDTLRITAQLIDGRDGAHLWSKTYDRELSGIFALQEEIARDVAQALSIRLDVGAMSRAQGGTTNVDAYDRYLRARKLSLAGGREASLKAAQLQREAVGLDPQFVRAWMGLGQAAGDASILMDGVESARLTKEAEDALVRARSLAPNSPAAQAVQLRDLQRQRKWAEADALTSELRQSTPVTAENLSEFLGGSGLLAATGRIGEVIRHLRQAQQLEPLSMAISNDLQRFLYAAGQFDAAQAENEHSKTLPGDWSRPRGRALLLEMRKENMDSQLVRSLIAPRTNDEGLSLPIMSSLADVAGDRKAMKEVLRKYVADSSDSAGNQWPVILQIADALGDRELALTAIQNFTDVSGQYWGLWIAPVSSLRSDPRFKEMLRKSGLADYFRSSGNWGDFCKPVGENDFECQ